MKPYTNLYEEAQKRDCHIPYTETFDEFCQAILLTGFLDKEQSQLIKGLLNQWENNGGK